MTSLVFSKKNKSISPVNLKTATNNEMVATAFMVRKSLDGPY